MGLDADQLIVGASVANQAYLFDADKGALEKSFNGPTGLDLFCWSVGLSNGRAIVGAPWFRQDGVALTGALFSYDRLTGGDRQVVAVDPVARQDERGRVIDVQGDLVLAQL